MPHETCNNCRAFGDLNNGHGVCRRRSPTALVQRYVSGTVVDGTNVIQVLNGLIDGFFPPTRHDLWCLDFVPGSRQDADAPQHDPAAEAAALAAEVLSEGQQET